MLKQHELNPKRKLTAREVFEERVIPRLVSDSSGCLLWTGARNSAGYGQTSVERKRRFVHRLAWEYENGEIPEGMLVLHHCDVRLCARIEHLFLGSQSDNMLDCAAKGRLWVQKRRLNGVAA